MKALSKRHVMDRKIVERLLCGEGTNAIARTLHVSKRRVVEVRKRAITSGYLDGTKALPQYPESLFPEQSDKRNKQQSSASDELFAKHRVWIEERLDAGWQPITVYEELSLGASQASFYRYLKRHNLSNRGQRARRVVPEILTAPGESLQLDWGKLCTVTVEGKRKTLWMLIGVLGYSRLRLVRLVWSNDLPTTIDALASMFDELGGVPAKVTTDNPKCFATKADKYEPILNQVMERFASHYGFILECLPPRAPEMKGKVERQVPFIRRLYQAHGEFLSREESEEYLRRKLTIVNGRKHGSTKLKPSELFEQEEQETLRCLPTIRYDIEQYHSGKVRQDGHVRFFGKYYSLDERFIGETVTVIGNSTKISIYSAGKLVETHDRIHSPHIQKSTKKHHLKAWEQAFDQDSLYRTKARRLGEWVEELVIAILEQGNGFIDQRKIWGILSLDKTFTASIINEACMHAFDAERYSYQAVRGFAKNLAAIAKAEKKESVAADKQQSATGATNKFTHPIETYAQHVQLTLLKGGKDE